MEIYGEDGRPRPSTPNSAAGSSARLHNQRRGCPILARFFAQEPALSGVERVGTTLIAQWALPFKPPSACCDIGTLFNPVILSGTLSFGKANDKVESKDPMFVDTTPGNARRSHRAVIARGPAKAVHPPQN